MTNRPRLVHVTTTDVSLDWLLSPQLCAFQDEGYEVTAVSAPGSHVESIEAAGIRHVPVGAFTRRMDPLADIRAARELRAVLSKIRPDILHTHNPKPGIIGRVVGRTRRVPVVVNTVHGLYAQPTDALPRRALVYAAEAIALRFSDMELVQNIEDLRTLRRLGAPSSRLVHLGNGIDLGRFGPSTASRARGMRIRQQLGIRHDQVLIGAVGRLVWEKGYGELIDAIEILQRAGYGDLAFVVVGPTEPSKTAAVDDSTIERMSAAGVHLLGERNDVENIYAALDLFVLPSHREGVPRAAMEASAMGVPVVATDIRGCRQVVADGRTGTLVPTGDAVALARAISGLVGSPAMRRAMGEAGRRRARQHFDQNAVIDLTLSIYENQLLAARGFGGSSSRRANLLYRASSSAVVADTSKVSAPARAA